MLNTLRSVPKKNGYRYAFIASLLLFALCGSIILYMDHAYKQRALTEQSYYFEKNQESVFAALHLYTEQLKQFYNELLIYPELQQWLQAPGPLSKEMLKIRNIQRKFIHLTTNHNGVQSVYLHNRKNDLVLSTSYMMTDLSGFPKRDRFAHIYQDIQGPTWQWRSDHDGMISMVAGIPNRNKLGAIAINLDASYMSERLFEGMDHIIWTDAEGQVILANNAANVALYERYAETIAHRLQRSFSIDNHLIITSESVSNGWKLISVIPEDVLLAKQQSGIPYKYALIALLFVLLFSFPVYFRRLHIVREKRYAQAAEQGIDHFRTSLVIDLLNGKPLPFKQTGEETAATHIPLNLQASAYRVVVFHIDNYFNYLLDKSNEERFFLNKVIFNSIRWTFALKMDSHVTMVEPGKIVVLLSFDDAQPDDQVLEDTIRYIQQDINDHFRLTLCVSISEQLADISHIHEGYAHAIVALDYKALYGRNSLIYYEQLSLTDPSAIDALLSELNTIYEALQAGDLQKIEALLDHIIATLSERQPATLDWIHAVFAHLLSIMNKFAIEQQLRVFDKYNNNPFMMLYSLEFIEEKHHFILSICEEMIHENRAGDNRQDSPVVNHAIDYMNDHYDQQISLNMLADKFNLSPSYLSVLIKNGLGIGFAEYITRLRLQKALTLLEDPDLTIQHIARQCGYDTVHTFIRQFKKSFSVPPNEYRNRHGRQQRISAHSE